MINLSEIVSELSEGKFRARAGKIAKTTKDMADALVTLSEMGDVDFSHLGSSMEEVASGFTAWSSALSAGGLLGKAGEMFTKFEKIGKSFKELALGIYVLGETRKEFSSIAEGMELLGPKIGSFMDNVVRLSNQKIDSLNAIAEFFKVVSMLQAKDLSGLIDGLSGLPAWVDSMVGPLERFSEISKRKVNSLIDLMKASAETDMELSMETKGSVSTEVTGLNNIGNTIKAAIESQTLALEEKLDSMFTTEWLANMNGMATSISTATLRGRLRVTNS
jgi:hypothetical protein